MKQFAPASLKMSRRWRITGNSYMATYMAKKTPYVAKERET